MENNLTWHEQHISKHKKSIIKNQKPCLLWFTGLSGSGKSSIANSVDNKLYQLKKHTSLLDGDNVRHGLCKDLGFSDDDRTENIRRIGEVSKLMVDTGLIVLTAFISPFREDRLVVRNMFSEHEFIEVFINTPLFECERRDLKGLYKQARIGIIKNFTGIDSPYEEPKHAEITIDNESTSIDAASDIIVEFLKTNGYLKIEE